MAGFTRLYVVGGAGGFSGSDGANPILLQILVGEGNRQWLEPHYFDSSLRPIAEVRTIIPASPNHPDAVLDACIAFFPDPFRECASFADVEEQLQGRDRLDFNLEPEEIPASWASLREEARRTFRRLNIWQADLTPLAEKGGAKLSRDARNVLDVFRARGLRAGAVIQYPEFESAIRWGNGGGLADEEMSDAWRALVEGEYVIEYNAGFGLTPRGEAYLYGD